MARNVPYRFATVLGIGAVNVNASASARIGSPAGMNQFIPFAVHHPTMSGLTPGDSLTLHYNSEDQTKGNSLAVSFPGDAGADDFRKSIVNGSPTVFCVAGQEYDGCPSTLETEPGVMNGPIQQGFNDLKKLTSAQCDTFDEVFVQDASDPGKYTFSPRCNPFPPYSVTDSKQVVIVPIIPELCAGRCQVQILRFSLFFVEGVKCGTACQVDGRYAEVSFDWSGVKLGPYNDEAGFKFTRLVE